MSSQLIIKADGSKVPFDKEKFVASLSRAKASPEAIDAVLKHIESELIDGVTTHHIYKHAFSLLRHKEKETAVRYSLRRSLEDLGPSGFPFESYISELFKVQGFETNIRQTLQGRCVSHEIDVVAWNEQKMIAIESKFHNQQGMKTDIKTALYVKARFDDLSEQLFSYGRPRPLDEGWLVTNTKFTTHAIQYAQCADVKLLGWNYPEKGNLQDIINDYHLHPITCLPSLSKKEREMLLLKDIVLCKDVLHRKDDIREAGLPPHSYDELLSDAEAVCGLS